MGYSLALLASAQNGSVSFNGETISHAPNANFFGRDSFTYSVTDSGGLSVNGVVTVQVNSITVPNDPRNNNAGGGGALSYELLFLLLYSLIDWLYRLSARNTLSQQLLRGKCDWRYC